MPKGHLSKVEIFLLTRAPKFIPMPEDISKAVIKKKIEASDRKIRLMWHYCNEKWQITISPFKKNLSVKSFGRGILPFCTKDLVIRIWQRRKGKLYILLEMIPQLSLEKLMKALVLWSRTERTIYLRHNAT